MLYALMGYAARRVVRRVRAIRALAGASAGRGRSSTSA